MAKRKNCKNPKTKNKTSKTSRLITRILGSILMLFILIVLLFVGFKFVTADKGTVGVLPPNAQLPSDEPSLSDEASTTKPKYSFYNELKQRSNEVEAEINHKIVESEQHQQQIEGDNYRIQVGAFRDKDKADRLRARIILRDYPVMILRSNSMYLVQVGPYKEREEALSIQKSLQREGMTTLLKNYVAQ